MSEGTVNRPEPQAPMTAVAKSATLASSLTDGPKFQSFCPGARTPVEKGAAQRVFDRQTEAPEHTAKASSSRGYAR